MINFWDNFYSICIRRGTTPTAVCAEVGLSNSMQSDYKKGTVPKLKTLCDMADYLNTSLDDLLGRTPKPEAAVNISTDRQLLELFSALSITQKAEIILEMSKMKDSNQA